jgi:hypothetical protein
MAYSSKLQFLGPMIENLLGFKCTHQLFANNGPDGDYAFVNPEKVQM